MKKELSDGIYYQSSYFISDMNVEKIESEMNDEKAERWDDDDQYQIHQEALSWMSFSGREVDDSVSKQNRWAFSMVTLQ